MAHEVYPGATHSRLEHSLGVLEASERMISALRRNAQYRRTYGDDRDEGIPEISQDDHYTIRLAALLHDCGHAPYSHASEGFVRGTVEKHFAGEYDSAILTLRSRIAGVRKVQPSELVAALIVLTEALRAVFVHSRFGIPVTNRDLGPTLAARILGSYSNLDAGYLSGIVSGPLDADKLDYMARDSHHSGLPLGLDLERLIGKLEVIIVTPASAPTARLRQEAEESPRNRLYEMGISSSGLGAYEQMVIARVFLYDRLYYHQKVRAAEAMLMNLLAVAEDERGAPLTLEDLYADANDHSIIPIVAGYLRNGRTVPGQRRAQHLAAALLTRQFFHRAFVFSQALIETSGLPRDSADRTKQLVYDDVLGTLSEEQPRREMAAAIFELAKSLAEQVEGLLIDTADFGPEHVVIDVPPPHRVTAPGNMLARTEGGKIHHPHHYFDPEKWSKAYQEHRHFGFVFCPQQYVPVVATASAIVFWERFNLLLTEEAAHVAKTRGLDLRNFVKRAANARLCSIDAAAALGTPTAALKKFSAQDIVLPDEWRKENPELAAVLAESLNIALPAGLPGDLYDDAIATIVHLTYCVKAIVEGGSLRSAENLKEAYLQGWLRDMLRSRSCPQVHEGSEFGGGETDLIVTQSRFVIENKVLPTPTNAPLDDLQRAGWQARRYSIATATSVGFLFGAYIPRDEGGHFQQSDLIRIQPLIGAKEGRVVVSVAVPYNYPAPSRAHAPRA